MSYFLSPGSWKSPTNRMFKVWRPNPTLTFRLRVERCSSAVQTQNVYGRGSKLSHQGTAGFGLWFDSPGQPIWGTYFCPPPPPPTGQPLPGWRPNPTGAAAERLRSGLLCGRLRRLRRVAGRRGAAGGEVGWRLGWGGFRGGGGGMMDQFSTTFGWGLGFSLGVLGQKRIPCHFFGVSMPVRPARDCPRRRPPM